MRIPRPDLRKQSCVRFDFFWHLRINERVLRKVKSIKALSPLGAKEGISIESFYLKDKKKALFRMSIPKIAKPKGQDEYRLDVSTCFLPEKSKQSPDSEKRNAPFELLSLLAVQKQRAAIFAASAVFAYPKKKYESLIGLPTKSALSAGLEFEILGTMLKFKEETGDIREYYHIVDVSQESDISHILMFHEKDAELKPGLYATTLSALSDKSKKLLLEKTAEK